MIVLGLSAATGTNSRHLTEVGLAEGVALIGTIINHR